MMAPLIRYATGFIHRQSRSLLNSARLFSSAQKEHPSSVVQFDAEVSKINSIVSENHRHPNGPWVAMLDKIHDYSNTNGSKFAVLNLATGTREPAETITRQFPDCTVVATDISPDQVAIANAKAITLPHMINPLISSLAVMGLCFHQITPRLCESPIVS